MALMDAIDEFFSQWCEPEAWCDRCGERPAMHVVVRDNAETSGNAISYVRIWDPAAQASIAICRQCSREHIAVLGTKAFQYAPPKHDRPQRPRRRRYPSKMSSQHLGYWRYRIRLWLMAIWQCRLSPRRQEETSEYTRTHE